MPTKIVQFWVPLAVQYLTNRLTRYAIGSTVHGMKLPPPKRRFNRPLQVRVTPAQYAQFTRAAKASGLTLSAWARTRLIQMARRDRREAAKD
ncbi:MAG TPA: hypothetical protein VN648_21065 [Candidatus Methylomirabilis sp.]|nr:hypothetical protein [Candidatus Methylomirabilis sp.]